MADIKINDIIDIERPYLNTNSEEIYTPLY